ncbi:MAG: phosphate acyltransferase [Smithellaceae bacterium]
MIRNFKQILEKAQDKGRKRLAVPEPRSRRVLQLLKEAEKAGLIIPLLVGKGRTDKSQTKDVIDKAMAMAQNGEADLLFQGDVGMDDFINALTVKEAGIAERGALSYISLFELPSDDRLIMLTDTLIQAFPSVKQKVRILQNAIDFAMILGIEKPKIAALSTLELVNFSVPSSVDAAVLAMMSQRKQLNAVIDGPLDIDCASSRERALRKGLESPVAGQVDIYLFPDIEASYSIAEVLVLLGRSTLAGVLMGTGLPVVLNPRFESPSSLLLDIALASIRN